MEIDVQIDGAQVRLRLRGRGSLADGDLLKRTVARCLEQGHRLFVLNFEDVSEIDSASLGDVMAAYVAVLRHHGRMTIEGARGQPGDLFSKLPPPS